MTIDRNADGLDSQPRFTFPALERRPYLRQALEQAQGEPVVVALMGATIGKSEELLHAIGCRRDGVIVLAPGGLIGAELERRLHELGAEPFHLAAQPVRRLLVDELERVPELPPMSPEEARQLLEEYWRGPDADDDPILPLSPTRAREYSELVRAGVDRGPDPTEPEHPRRPLSPLYAKIRPLARFEAPVDAPGPGSGPPVPPKVRGRHPWRR